MSDLHASIQSLTHIAALIPDHAGHLAQELTAVHTASDEYMAKVQDKQTQAVAILSHVQTAFHEFEQELTQYHAQLEQNFNDLDHDTETLEKFITEAKVHFHQEIETTRQKLGTWKTQLETHRAAAEAARGVAQGAVAGLHTKVQREKSHLESTVSTTHHEVDELLRHQLITVKTTTNEHIIHMTQEMEHGQSSILSKVHDLLQHFDNSNTDLSQHLTNISHSVIQVETEHLLHDIQHQIGEELQHQVDAALHQVIDVLDHMHNSMGGDSEHLSTAHTELEKPIHEAEHTIELVKKAIHAVVHFAEHFGVHLGIDI